MTQMTNKTNEFICRGRTKDNTFRYGYYCKFDDKHYLITDFSRCVVDRTIKVGNLPVDLLKIEAFIEIIGEPSRFYKEINGIKLFENDTLQYTVKGRHNTPNCTGAETIVFGQELEIDLESDEIVDLKVIKNILGL